MNLRFHVFYKLYLHSKVLLTVLRFLYVKNLAIKIMEI